MKLLPFILILFISFFPGKPAGEVLILLESGDGREQVAFQKTGIRGKAGFKYLNEGSYRLLVEFSQQDGKWIKEKPRHNTLTKATWNPVTKTYYYQGAEGYFSVKIGGLKKVDKERFQPLFRENRTESGTQIIIAGFLTKNNGAQISVFVKAITAAQYKRQTDRAGSDISAISIPGAR